MYNIVYYAGVITGDDVPATVLRLELKTGDKMYGKDE